MTYDKVGEIDVRKTLIDATLQNLVKKMYKMKQAVMIASTGAWTNHYFREDPDTLEAGLSRTIKGIPRGAAFPQASTSWEKVRTDIEKYGLEESIPYEDIISNEVNVRDRTLFKIADGIAYSVDTQIYTGLSTDGDIQTFATGAYGGTHNSGGAWNQSSAQIMDDLEYAEELIGDYHYPTNQLMVFINHRDKRAVMNFLFEKGAQIPNITDKTLNAGTIGTLGNKTFVVADVVAASHALVVVPKVCANWKELLPFTTDVNAEPLKDVRIRAAEMGVLQVVNPKAIVFIEGTEFE